MLKYKFVLENKHHSSHSRHSTTHVIDTKVQFHVTRSAFKASYLKLCGGI